VVTKRKPSKIAKKSKNARTSGHSVSDCPATTAPETSAAGVAEASVDDPFEDAFDFESAESAASAAPAATDQNADVTGGAGSKRAQASRAKQLVELPNQANSPDTGTQASGSRATDSSQAATQEAQAGQENSASRESQAARKTRQRKKTLSPASLVKRVALCVVVLLLAFTAVYSWDRWFRYDDALDFVGEWQIHGSNVTILIGGESINLADDAAYDYTLDTRAKTIHFTLGTMEGGGAYRFSADRNQLVVVDGSEGFWLLNAVCDIPWTVSSWLSSVFGLTPPDPSGDGVSVLDRPESLEASQDSLVEPTTSTNTGASSEQDNSEASDASTSDDEASNSQTSEADGGSSDSASVGTNANKQDEDSSSGSENTAGKNAITLEDLTGDTQ
jgi:hypothetical protein